MAKRESFLGRNEDDDDYWLGSAQLSKLKSENLFDELISDDTIEEDPWSLSYTDPDGFERVPRMRSDQTFTAGSVSERMTGSARYRSQSVTSQQSLTPTSNLANVTESVQLMGLDQRQNKLQQNKDLADNIEPVKSRRAMSRTSVGPAIGLRPEAMIKEMILGKPYQFESFKSKEEKLALLDAALEAGDGNCITAVVLFLNTSLKRSLFNKAIQNKPVALNHYISYLRAHYDFMELEDTLCMFQRTEDASILKYNMAASKLKPLDKVRALQACHRTHFEYEPTMANDGILLKQHISLLERQLPIEDADQRAVVEDTNIGFKDRPRAVNTIVNLPLLSTLHYTCLYHFADPPNFLASPYGVREEYKLDERQFLWWALKARAEFHDYAAIETLLTSKSWYGGKKMKSVIPWEKVVVILHEYSAPMEVITKYLKLIDDESTRFQTANKFCCYKVAVDTLIAMKDRRQLESYVAKVLSPSSLEYRWAQDALLGTTVKWKN